MGVTAGNPGEMTNDDQCVLDAIAHCPDVEAHLVSSPWGPTTIYCVHWATLQGATDLSDIELEASTNRLFDLGLIRSGRTPYNILGLRIGRLTSSYFWATQYGLWMVAARERLRDTIQRNEYYEGLSDDQK